MSSAEVVVCRAASVGDQSVSDQGQVKLSQVEQLSEVSRPWLKSEQAESAATVTQWPRQSVATLELWKKVQKVATSKLANQAAQYSVPQAGAHFSAAK